jgi:hypothetical protein
VPEIFGTVNGKIDIEKFEPAKFTNISFFLQYFLLLNGAKGPRHLN